MIEKGDWLYSFELKAGYHHVNVCESCQTYLGFHGFWEVGNNILCLLFGHASACYLFTKLLCPMVRY